jgi:GNAT superfamily N-acetyltransferase
MMPPSEQVESEALRSLHDGATAQIVEDLSLSSIKSGRLFASIAPNLPPSAIVINRALGLGLDGRVMQQDVLDLVAAYQRSGTARYFIQVTPGDQSAEIADWLLGAGLEKARGWQKFSRDDSPAPIVSTDLRVRRVGPEHNEAFGRVVCHAFDIGERAIPWLARLPSQPHWHAFMTFDGDQPAGAGALYIRDGNAWSDFGATAPDFRRRGSQSALLAHRIGFAIEQGCRRIYTCTGEEVAGDPQHSYRNILRMGFCTEYVRENFAPAI